MNSIESILSMAESKAMDDALTAQMNHEKFMRNVEFPDQRTNKMSNSDINYGQVGNQFRDWLKNEASLFVQEQGEDAHYAANCAFIAGYEAAKQDSWQPIESVPSNQDVLVWTDDGACVAWCAKGHLWNMPTGFHDAIPTHWQPLPQPPKEQS